MRNRLAALSLALFLLCLAVAIGGGLFWGNLQFSRNTHTGVEFLAVWKPAQNFALQGISPYNVENTLEVQRLVYGRVARTGERSFQFVLPFYFALLFFPLASIRDFFLAHALWMTLLQLAVSGLIVLSLRLSRWQASWFALPLISLFAVFWQPGTLALVDGNLVLAQSLLVFGALRAIESEADELAGALAALGLISLRVSGLVLLLLAVWVFSTGRYRILAGFLMTITVLIAVAFLVYPGWFTEFFFSSIIEWRTQVLPSTFRSLEHWFPGLGTPLAQGLRAVAIVILFLEWQAVRGKGVHWLFWTASLTAVLTPWFGMKYAPAWTAFSLPAIILVFSVMGQRWGLLGRLAALLIGTALFVGLWQAYLSGFDSVFLFAYPPGMTLLLYWVRWWATRPPRLWADMLTQGR
ncbi:MAG: hypothetical protein N2117_08800 [Anaerolineales bacterium]|nr:hypothetical protein [Anaerolineales bacterium]MCX7755332.1 hypothetical protein [Anaerolineales bacterium]MDW8279311.1 hypothetical protein [Anaerolineales bacterium]